MAGKRFCLAILIAGLLPSIVFAQPVGETVNSSSADSATGDSALQREYARLAQLLNSNDVFGKREAADTLLRVRPGDVTNADTRKLIARGYRSLAMEQSGLNQDTAIRGLVIWGGRHSVPVLIDLMDKSQHRVSDEIFTALGQLKDPRGAEAVARYLGNFFNHDAAVSSLRRMGSAAESALIQAAPANDPKVSLAAIQLLGEVGGEKSLALLQKASQARNQAVKQAARDAIKRIRTRQKSGESPDTGAAIDPDSPFADGSGPPVDITARNSRAIPNRSEPTEPETANLDEGDWSQINALLPGEPAGTGVPADPARDVLPADWRPQPTRLNGAGGGNARPVAFDVAGGKSPVAAVVYGDPFNKSLARLEFLNLRQRKSVRSMNILGGTQSVHLSPSGARLLIVSQEGSHNSALRLEVWNVVDGKLSQHAVWWPYASSGDHWTNRELRGRWVDDEHLLTVGGQEKLVLWRLDGKSPRAVYQLDNAAGGIALSPGRAHLAAAVSGGLGIFRAIDGELLARMADAPSSSGLMAFNADGTRLASVAGQRVFVWNAANGKQERNFDCPGLQTGSVHWLDDHHLLVGPGDVVDIGRRLILWRYESTHLPTAFHGGWQWLVMQSGSALGIVPAKLLHEEVLAAAHGLNPDEILAIKPGAKVSLDIQVGGEEQAKAEAAVRAGLEQNGLEVADGQPLQLTARIVTGDTQTQEYGRHAFSRDTQQVTLTEKRYEVELTIDDQLVWKQGTMLQSSRGSLVILRREGESAQQAVDRENAQRATNFRFDVSLPRYVVHPKYAGPLGTSKITLGGAR
jgi:hypothetical protein